jgi:transposase-like protein
MRRYSEAVQSDVRRRMSPPHRQSVAQISQELGIHQATLYNWRKSWRLQGRADSKSVTSVLAGAVSMG